MDREKIKFLIEFSSSVEEADNTVIEAGFTDVEEKIKFLDEMFGIRLVGRCDDQEVSDAEIREMDYYAILNTVISCRWGA